MSSSAWLVLISHISGLAGITGLGALVGIALHLLIRTWNRLLLSHCRHGGRGANSDQPREN
jgi:hypothetical protein